MKLFGRKPRGGGDGANTHDRASDRTDRAHLEEFARTRQGVEAFVEPRTAVTETTVVLVATIACALLLNGVGLMLYDNATSQTALGQEIDAMALVVGENGAAALTRDDARLGHR